ncbi:MAG: hypothetical protein II115_08375 [Prevotella sp.]|nr:hypothetical protein [Prevotella sp.]MBQ5496808.1 hypothetical protein [Prevotella sp.]
MEQKESYPIFRGREYNSVAIGKTMKRLVLGEITARAQRDYGSLIVRLRLVFLDKVPGTGRSGIW